MADPVESAGQRYRFGPLERSGVIAGWRGGQVACVGTSLVCAVVILRTDAHLTGLVMACAAVATGGFCAAWPVGGMTVEQWIPIVIRWMTGGKRLRTSLAPAEGRFGGQIRVVGNRWSMPGVLEGCTVLPAAAPGGGTVGVVCDERQGFYSAALVVSSPGFGLLEPVDRDQRVASWSALLAGLARERCPVDRLQWVTRSLPDGGQAVQAHFASARCGAVPPVAMSSYSDLLASEALDTMRHECFLVVRVNARRLPGLAARGMAPRDRSGDRSHAGRWWQSSRAGRSADHRRTGAHQLACGVVVREIASLAAQVRSAGVTVEGFLDPDSVAHVIGEAHRAGPCDRGVQFPHGGPWPMGARAEWSYYLTDGVAHAVYWIAEWPRVDVCADFLAPLLVQGDQRVTVSVVMEPLDPLRATRKVENARVSRAADEELRRRGGFASTARRRREGEALSLRETELADGHAPYRFSGYVGVTVSAIEDLEAACAGVEQAASKCFLSLRRLYGDQERAFTWLLPLARGLS